MSEIVFLAKSERSLKSVHKPHLSLCDSMCWLNPECLLKSLKMAVWERAALGCFGAPCPCLVGRAVLGCLGVQCLAVCERRAWATERAALGRPLEL